MVKIAICDDEEEYRNTALNYVGEYAERTGDEGILISSFFSGKQLLNAVEEYGSFDIYILDVVMPNMSGIDLGLELRKRDPDGKIIYLTCTPEYGANSYLTGAFFYLLKPVDKGKLFEVLKAAIERVRERKQKRILVKTSEQTTMLSYDDILYVELSRRSLEWSLLDGKKLRSTTVRAPFAELVGGLLKDDRFFICGASLAVNLYHVISVEKDGVVFKNKKKLYASKTACAAIRSKWLDFWLKYGGVS